MKSRLVLAVVVMVALSLVLVACGSSSTKKPVEDYMPKNGDIAGWVEDLSNGKKGLQAAHDEAAGTALIDGHISLFFAAGWVGMALDYYVRSDDATKTIELNLHEMTSKDAANNIYSNLSIMGSTTWNDCGLGSAADNCRIHKEPGSPPDVPDQYWLHATKDVYYVDIPQAVTGTDAAGQQMAIDFMSGVLKKLP